MPITKLTAGGTFIFTSTSGSVDTVAFAGGTETPFNYVFRNGIVTGISNINSASNEAYNIMSYTAIDNSAELYNRGTYRYAYRPIDPSVTTTASFANNNANKSVLASSGSLIAVNGTAAATIELPHSVRALDGTIVKIVRTESTTNLLTIKTTAATVDKFRGNIGTGVFVGNRLQSNSPYATIELLAVSVGVDLHEWLVTSYTGTWAFA